MYYRVALALSRHPRELHTWRYAAVGSHDTLVGEVRERSAAAAAVLACHRVHRDLVALLPIRVALDLPADDPLWRDRDALCAALPGLDLVPRRAADADLAGRARHRLADIAPAPVERLLVATDGAVKQRHVGYGWLATTGEFGLRGYRRDARLIGAEASTVAELQAIGDAVARLGSHPLVVLTDSQRAIAVATAWQQGGRDYPKGYVAGTAPRDLDLGVHRERLRRHAATVELRWVRGHHGDPLNEAADALARMARRRAAGLDTAPSAEHERRAAELVAAFLREVATEQRSAS